MRKILIIMMFFVFFSSSVLLAGEFLGMVDPFLHRIIGGHLKVEGGKIELEKGTWRFGNKEIKRDIKTGERIGVSYTCFCTYTVFNNSDRAYEVERLIHLYSESDSENRSPLSVTKIEDKKRIILKPKESHKFKDQFQVSRQIALDTKEAEVWFSCKEIDSK